VTSIGGSLIIGSYYGGNPSLTSLTALTGLTCIGGDLIIVNNNTLNSLTGLNNVTSIGGDLHINKNSFLTSLSGLNSLLSVSGSLIIGSYYGGNPSLTSLTGLNTLSGIGGDLNIIGNPALTSLTGLDNIEASSIMDLYIYDNNSLTTCEVNSICEYLVSPSGYVLIYGNAAGCNSQQEIETACGVWMEENKLSENHVNIYPNPTHGKITIEYTSNGHFSILNLSGQELITRQITEPRTQIDISRLPGGVYVVKLVGEKGVQIGKIMKE